MGEQEIENYADDGTWIGIISDISEDALDQCVPMSVILVVAAIWLAREFGGAYLKYKGAGK